MVSDSQWIAFDYTKEGNHDIFVINADGGPPRRVTTENGSNNGVRAGLETAVDLRLQSRRHVAGLENPRSGGAAVQITRSGGREAFESADGKFVYYAKSDTPGIWRTLADGGEETRVLDQVVIGQWALTGQRICFIDATSPAGLAIKHYDLATRQQRLTTVPETDRD
jgi:hypothetical protein